MKISANNVIIFLFQVLDPQQIVISFIAFIDMARCLKIYLHQTRQIGFIFILKMFHDKCNCNCNCDYFQCNQNKLHCGFVYS